MKRIAALLLLALPLCAQDYKLAIIGMVHAHVWGHLKPMLTSKDAKLVGIAETNPALIAEARKRGAADVPFFDDYVKMLDRVKPDIVWAFVENNRHLEIVESCATRKINVIFEKPLAGDSRDALAIQALARRSGIKIEVNYQMAWWPANYAAKAQADSGAVGQVWRLHGIVGHGGPGSTGLSKYFFDWLTDPVKNGAGALMDFECYNALWSLWYLGLPDTVYASVNHLRPEVFPKVEDTSAMILSYKKGVGVFEGSWDLPRSLQDLEVFGLKGSLYMKQQGVELRQGKETKDIPLETLPPERSEPVAYMVWALKHNKPIEGMVGLDINVEVNRIIEAAKMSIVTGRAIKIPPLPPAPSADLRQSGHPPPAGR
jgi:predicted dehydrogenase